MSGELTAEHGLLRGSHGSYGKIIGKKKGIEFEMGIVHGI
jgi:hypothetical protein